ncbi:hypothetical protein ACWD01_10625 [Streptomyces sp. NPDC002835]
MTRRIAGRGARAVARVGAQRDQFVAVGVDPRCCDGDELVPAAPRDGSPSCTPLLMAHRPPVIRRADRIAVPEAGRVVQTGGWDELAGEGGVFARVLAR